VELSGTGVAVPKTPTADAGGPYAMVPGTSLTLDASASVPTALDHNNLSYSWNVNGHAGAAAGVTPTLSWSQLTALGIGLASDGSAATFSVSVQVSDDHGNVVTSSPVSLVVANPSAGIFATPKFPNSGLAGAATSVTLVGNDPVPANQAAGFTYVIQWGDGSQQTVSGPTLSTATHVFTTTGQQIVNVRAIDIQGAISLPISTIIQISQPQAQVVDLMTTPRQVLTGALVVDSKSLQGSQTYQVDLLQNDFVGIAVAPGAPAVLPLRLPLKTSTLMITAPDGTQQQPLVSGGTADHPVYGFRAAQTGTYSIELLTSSSSKAPPGVPLTYTLDLHRLALAQGTQNPSTLQQPGPMYAFLAGNALSITGPTGYGFSISGSWTQTPRRTKGSIVGSIYSASGPLTLDTALGPVSFAANQAFVVTTKPGVLGAFFGEVSSIQTGFSYSFGDYLAKYTSQLTQFGLTLNTANLITAGWSIQLGSQINQQQQIGQVLGGVPYLFLGANIDLQGSFGGKPITVPKVPHVTPTVIVDPSDPFLYLSVPGVPVISKLGLSLHGRIPYVPQYPPTPGSGLTVTATVTGGALASIALDNPGSGYPASATFNVMVNQAGASGGIIAVTTNSSGVPVSVAVTGTTGSGYSAATGLSTTLLTQSLTKFFGQVFVNASVPFAIAGVPLSLSGDVTLGLDVNNTGQFLDGQANAGGLFGGTLANASTILQDVEIGVNGTLDVGFKYGGFNFHLPLGGASAVYNGPAGGVWFQAERGPNPLAGTPFASLSFGPHDTVEGAIFTNGQFFLTLTAGYTIGPGTLAFTLTLDNSGASAVATGNLKVELDKNDYAQFAVTAALDATFLSGKVKWSGSASATGKVVTILGSTGFGLTATVDQNEIVFDLPRPIGRVVIHLP
jgi:hypothetical protein